MLTSLIKFALLVAVSALLACTSSLEKVTDEGAPTMEEVYDRFTGPNKRSIEVRGQALLSRPAMPDCDQQLGFPPYPEQLDHLYPRLPNPDLFMYVRPHAVGDSGAPIPAYITRFSMYERQPYALPGETLDALVNAPHRVPGCGPTKVSGLPKEVDSE